MINIYIYILFVDKSEKYMNIKPQRIKSHLVFLARNNYNFHYKLAFLPRLVE